MGSLRNLRSEGTKEHRADELDQMDLAYGVPPEGLRLVLFDEDVDTVLVTFQARRSNFLERITTACRDYASHPQFSGNPAILAIQVLEYRNDEEFRIHLCPNQKDGALAATHWWNPGKEVTQETANTLWQRVVKLWASYKEKRT